MTERDLIAELRASIEAQSHPEIMTPAQAALAHAIRRKNPTVR